LKNLSSQDIINLHYHSIATIKEATDAGGLTIRSYWSPDGKPGTFKAVIYDQKHDPLGNLVEKVILTDKRPTHWVPAVQI